MGRGFSAVLLLVASAAAALEPAFVARSPIVNVDGVNCCDTFDTRASMAADGSFVVFWINENQLQARRFTSAGAPLGAELEPGVDWVSALAGRPGGGVLAVGQDSGGLGVWSFDAQGAGGRIVDFGPQPTASSFSIANGAAGDFLVGFATGSSPNRELRLHHFDGAGQPLTPVRTVATQQQGYVFGASAVSAAPDGQVQVVWEHEMHNGLTGSGDGLYRRRYDAAGQPNGGIEPLLTNAYMQETRMTAGPDGRVVVAFNSVDGLPFIGGLVADARGPVTPQLQLWREEWLIPVVPSAGFLEGGDIAVAADGWLLDEWTTINLMRTRADGQPAGPRIQVMPSIPDIDYVFPAIASNGDLVAVVWAPRTSSPTGFGPIAFQVFDATLFADSFETGGTGNWTVVE